MEAQAPARIDYRERARRHYDAAAALLATGNDDDLIYACLRLRLAIEALAYASVQLYRDDLPEDVLSEWKADKVLRELAALDPGADGDIEVRLSDPDGSNELVFNDHRLTAKWVRKAYPALGNFLHERTLRVLERGGDAKAFVVRRKAEEIAEEVRRVLDATGWGFRLVFNIVLQCDCGGDLVLRLGPVQKFGRAKCAACGLVHEIHRHPDNPDRLIGRRAGPGTG